MLSFRFARYTYHLRLPVAFVQLQPRLLLPLFQHLGVERLPSRQAVPQLLELISGETVAGGLGAQKPEWLSLQGNWDVPATSERASLRKACSRNIC